MKKLNIFLSLQSLIKKASFQLLVFSALCLMLLMHPNAVQSQTISWSNTGTASAWYTAGNWSPSTASGAWTTVNVAQFNNTGSATTAGINIGTAALSIGSIEMTFSRTRGLTIGNSSGTAGNLTLNGATVNSVANTILRNNSKANDLTLQNNETGTGKTMGIVLANATTNAVNVDSTGNIIISSNISGSGRNLTFNSTNTGDLRLSGTNSWSGGFTAAGTSSGTGKLRFDSTAAWPTTGSVFVNTYGRLSLNIAGTYGASSQKITFNPTQTTNGSLENNTSNIATTLADSIVFSAATRIEPAGSTGTITLSGVATGAGTIIKQAGGNLILSGTNALTGGTQIGNGKLTINSGSSMGTDSVVLFQTSTNNDTISLNNTAQTIGGLVSRFTATSGTQSQVILLGSGHTLTINQSYNTTFGTGAVATLTSTLASAGNLVKSGAGTLTLTSANTYTGTTTISGGTLALGIAKALSSSTNVTLNGGSLSTTGTFNQKLGTLNLNLKSTIALYAGVHSDSFAASNGVTWAGDTLFVTGWTGTAGSSGTGGKIFVGTSSSGLTTGQLAKIIFVGYSGPATILSTGEVIPSNPTPVITVTGTTKVLTTIYGTASAQDTIYVSGTNISGGIFISAPTGFEVSKTSGSSFKAIDTIVGSGTIASTRIYYRLKANATPATYRDSLVVTSSGATTVKAATAFDTVRTKTLTISGLTGDNKVYNATTAATVSGTASLVGVNFSDVVTVGGSPSSSFATATVGTGKAITTTGYTLGGAQAPYYTLTQPTGLTADITAKALTISGLSGVSRVYDATTTATLSGTPSLVGVETADLSNVTLGGSASASFATATAGSSKAITVTGYTISGAASGNYSVTQPTGLTANVTQATQTITFGSLANKVVGDPTFTLTATASSGLPVSYSSSVPSVASVSGSTVTVGVAGTTVITASQAGNTNYQAATSVNRNQVVDTAVLLTQTISFGALSAVTYGDAPFSLSATASSGLTVTYTSSNTAVATVSGSTVTIVAPGSTTITASQAGNSIYSAAADVAQTLTVNVKTLTVSGASATSKTYDRTNTATITGGSLVGTIGADTVTFSGGGTFADANVGTGKTVTGALILAGAQASRYALTQPSLTADITAKNLTISGVSGNNKPYDATTTATLSGTATLVGVVAADVSNVVLGGTPSATFATSAIGTGIAITVSGYTISGSASGNYSLTQPTGITANITTITLTISGLTGNNKVYDRNTTATLGGSASLVGVLAADVSNVTLGGSPSSTFATATVGTGKTITTTGYTISGSASGNYTLTQPSATANITTKALTVTGATAVSKTYDATTTATITGGSLVGIISSDVVTFSGGGAFADANVGTVKSVTAALTLGGTDAGNYSITQPTLTADINAKNLTISGKTGNNKPYDATTTATLSGTATLVGVITADVSNVVLGGTPSATFATSAIGTGIAITVTGYTISGSASGNYSLTQPTGLTANITTITLTISGLTGNNKVYDRNTTATLSGTPSLVGVLAADVSNVTLGGSPSSTFATATVGTGKTITTTGYTISGSASGNYTLTQPSATANITTKALTVSGATAVSKTYDATTTATITGGSLVGIISSDVVTFSGGGAFADANVGTAKAVTAALTLGGTDAGNYSITQPTGLTANITKANQTITFTALASKTTSDSAFTLTATASSGLTVTYASSNGSVATVSGSTLTITGAGTSNITASQAGNANWNAATDVVQAQVVTQGPIAAWDVTSYTSGGVSPAAATEKNSNVTVTGLTRGSGLSSSGLAGSAWGASSFDGPYTTAASAITNNKFATFVITPASGYSMSLSSIPSYNIRRSSTGPTTGQWQYKVGSGSFVDIGSAITYGSVTTASGNTQSAITLSGISALQNVSSAVTFRIVSYNSSGSSGTWHINTQGVGNDFQVNGTVNLPSVSTTATPKILTTTYGTASTQDTINVSGTSISGGIFIAAPTGFEVSITSGAGFKAIDTISGSGTISSTPVYYRIKASTTPGTYRDSLVITSGSASAKVATAFDTVNTKALTISGLAGVNRVYNATTTATLSGTATLVGVNFSDVVTVGGSPSSSFATSSVGTGKAITTTGYTLGGAQAAYYTLTQPTGLTANITAKTLTITGLTGVSRVYDATTTATLSGTPSLVGVETVDTSNVLLGGSASASFATATAGTGKAITVTGYTISGSASGNYSLTQPTGLTANITQATQTITFGALVNKTEGDPTFTLTATASSGLPVSYSSSVPSVASVSGSTVTVGIAGTTVITASQAGDVNYQAAISVNQNQVVDTAVLLTQTISFGALSTVTYGDAPFALTATASSGLTVSYTSSNTSVATVSGSTVTIVGSGSTTITASQPGNSTYRAAIDVPQTLTVNTKSVTITGALATSKTYNRTNTAAITGGSLVGIIGTDTVTFSGGGTFADANVGTGKTVTGALILAGAQASRYALTQPSLIADITAKNLTISGVSGNNKPYDGTTTASLSGTATLSGIIAPDVVTVSGSPSSVFATSAVGTGIAITVTGYTISGSASGNYSVMQPTGLAANITAKSLTISGLTGNNKEYDRNTTATLSGTPSLVGVVAADVSNVTLGGSSSSTFATATVGTGKTITTTGYTISGSASGNYTLTQPSATANITAKALTVSGATAVSKTYDATTTATITGGSLVGIISSDVVTFSGGGTFADANVGTAKAVTAALTLGGTDAGNYSITQPTGLTANITKANQTITFAALASKTTSDAPFTLTATASSGLTVTYASSNGAVATVLGSTLTINGAGTSNITASQAGDANWNAATDVVQAQVVTQGPIAAWDVTGYSSAGFSPAAATEKNSNVTVTGLTRGSGLSVPGSPASAAWGASGFDGPTTSAGAISSNKFATFVITPASGYSMSISSIPSYNIRRSSTGPTTGQWQYKVGSGSFVDIGSAFSYGSGTSSTGNTQSAITLSGISALQNVSSAVTFRLVSYSSPTAGSGGTWYINTQGAGNDFQVNGTVQFQCASPTKLTFTTQPTTIGGNINQGASFNVVVSAVCEDGNVASGLTTGSVTLDFSGCGLNSGVTYPGNTKTANFVGGVATFSNLSVSRSTQSGVYFTTTNTASLRDTTSNTFNIIAPTGSTLHDTLKNDNFSTRPIAWSWTTGTPTTVGSGGTSGTDVSGISTISGNSFFRKSYSVNNGSGEKGTTNTFTFANVTGLSAYSTTDFTFKVASSVGLSGTGAGNDVGEDLTLDLSTDGGTTWTKILTHQGGANKVFSFGATPQYTLSPTSNTTFSGSSSQSSFKVTLPSGTSQVRFRMTATNNRNEESWAIDDLMLIGHTPSGGAVSPLPTVSIVGGDIICGPPYNATLSSTIVNGLGGISYRWSPGSSLADSTIASPVASPSSPTAYSLVATDSVGCVATSAMPATVNFPTPEIVLANTTTTSSGYCDAADGYRYYQAAGSSPAEYFFAINWDADHDGIIDSAAKAASVVTVTVLSAPFASTAVSHEHGSVLLKRYWDVDIASSSMSEPVDVKFYYEGTEKTQITMKRDSNKAAAALLTPYALHDVPFSWFKTVGRPMNSTILSMINGNDFSAFPSITLTDANTGSLTDGAILYARFNSVMSFSGGTGGVGFSPYSGAALPIELLSFTATPFNNQVNLNWSTATEINNDFFTIERSQDGIRFEPILTKKGAGNSTTTLNYRAEDKSPLEGISYYRLKQTDFDGQFTYSMIRSVDFDGTTPILITHYPNPIAETVRFEFTSNSATPANYVIYDAMGNMVYRGNTSTQPGINNLELDLSKLSSGIYIIKMEVDGTQLTDKFLKQ